MAKGFLNRLKNRIKDDRLTSSNNFIGGKSSANSFTSLASSPTSNLLPTGDSNVTALSKSPILEVLLPQTTIRDVVDDAGEVIKSRVSDITQDGFITLFGEYAQNFVDIPKFDLSSINVINDEEVTFKFILCLKDGIDSTPKLYATSETYNELQQQYKNDNPIPTNYLINQRKLIVINIGPVKTKVEELRIDELNLDINLSNIDEKDYVTVFKNLFVTSNYESDNVIGLKANPTYDIIEVLRYISWVVSKPPQNYNNRVLPAQSLGEWASTQDDTPSESEPSTQINNEVDDNNNPAPPPTPAYPPIGRIGRFDEEEQIKNGIIWVWDEESAVWQKLISNGGGGPGGRGDS